MEKERFHPAFLPLFNHPKTAEEMKNRFEKRMEVLVHRMEVDILEERMVALKDRLNEYIKDTFSHFRGQPVKVEYQRLIFNNEILFELKLRECVGDKYSEFIANEERLFQQIVNQLNTFETAFSSFKDNVEKEVLPNLREVYKHNILYQTYLQESEFDFKENGSFEWRIKTPFEKQRNGYNRYPSGIILSSEDSEKNIAQLILIAIHKVATLLSYTEGYVRSKFNEKVQNTAYRSYAYSSFHKVSLRALVESEYVDYKFDKGMFYYTPAILEYSKEQFEGVLKKIKRWMSVNDMLSKLHHRVYKDFTWTNNSEIKGYSLQKKVIHFDISDSQVLYLMKEIEEALQPLLDMEKNAKQEPSEMNTPFKTIYVRKLKTYVLNGEVYQVYRIRGESQPQTRAYKNGVLLSSHQFCKSKRKHKNTTN